MAGRAQEIGILKSISYDRNIVQFYGACVRSASSEPMLLLEYCEGGDVRCAAAPPPAGTACRSGVSIKPE